MSSFCVFGMTALVARAMAEDEIGWYTGSGINRRELTREERAVLVDARAAELFEKRKTRQISPAFDAPQFAREWLDIAHRSTAIRGGVSWFAGPRWTTRATRSSAKSPSCQSSPGCHTTWRHAMRDEIPVTEQEEVAWREMERRQAQADHQPAGVTGAPERIFLVMGELDGPVRFGDLAEVTWSEDRQFDADIEYVRAQPVATTVPASDEPPFLQRLRDEVRELNGRLEKLEAFIPTAAFRMLDDTDRVLLQRQANQMHGLAQTLNQRIHNAAEKHRREAGSPQGGAE